MRNNIKKTLNLLAVGVLATTVLAACGQDTKVVSVKENNKTQENVKKQNVTKKEQTTPKLGSRSNPVPFKKTATVEDQLYDDSGKAFPMKFELTVEEVIRGAAAYQQLKKMNEFNDPASQGYEWVLVKAKVKFTESKTQDLAFHIDGIMNFKMVSESGDIYSGDIVATTNPEFSFEMYVGNEKEGYIAGLVKTGEKAELRYEEMMNGQVFFNLQ